MTDILERLRNPYIERGSRKGTEMSPFQKIIIVQLGYIAGVLTAIAWSMPHG